MRAWSLWSFTAVFAALTIGGGTRAGAQAPGPVKVDSSLAAWGKRIWNSKQCFGCHQLGKAQSTGPDLIGVTDRRTTDWIQKWLTDPVGMTESDSIAAALKKQYKTQMPNLNVSAHDIDGLINFLAQETANHGAK
ncbi:MAG TPA: cytochrome c [Gemmatimonadales bacterium]|nr:cytochrome c [Gemmatimonadales bacterium]